MSDPTSYPEEKLIENEMVFRAINESVQESFDRLKEIAKEDDQEHLVLDSDTAMHYYCECADENCHERIIITPSEYNEIHKNRKQFIVNKNHDVPTIEKIVSKKPTYYVVEKFTVPPEKTVSLNDTDVNNV